MIYRSGGKDGSLEQNFSKAITYFEKAAAQGNTDAQSWVGNHFLSSNSSFV